MDKEKKKDKEMIFKFGDIIVCVERFSTTMSKMTIRSPERTFVKYVEYDKVGEEVANVCF